MVHRLSCSVACGIFPGPGLEPVSPALAGGFLTTVPAGKPQLTDFKSLDKKVSDEIKLTLKTMFFSQKQCKCEGRE